MFNSTITQYGNVIAKGQITATTAGQNVRTLIDAAIAGGAMTGYIGPNQIYALTLTNNDPTATVYLAADGTPAATRSSDTLAPNGGKHNANVGVGVLNTMRIAATANANVYVVVYG